MMFGSLNFFRRDALEAGFNQPALTAHYNNKRFFIRCFGFQPVRHPGRRMAATPSFVLMEANTNSSGTARGMGEARLRLMLEAS